MDALTGLLDGPRARGAFLLRCVMAAPWSVRIQDDAALTLLAQVAGESVVRAADGSELRLAPGDVAVVRGPEPYAMTDPATPPGRAPDAVVHPGQRCTTPDGAELALAWHHGVRTWGNDPHGPTTVLVGTYEVAGAVSTRLLRALPPLLRAPRGTGAGDAEGADGTAAGAAAALVPVLGAEVVRDAPGQDAVLDRLLDLLLITVLRSWFARPGHAPAWYAAWADVVVGGALRAMHRSPAEPWTVERLARDAGVSRAAFARRFTELVGEPPMTYLAGWRLALAADLLAEPDATLGAVARRVGYGTPFALSAAFKRVRGVSPQQHRERVGVR